MEKFYTSEEAAQVLSVCIDTVRRYLRAGKLRGHRLGKGYRIPESELRRLLQAEELPAQSLGSLTSRFAITGVLDSAAPTCNVKAAQ